MLDYGRAERDAAEARCRSTFGALVDEAAFDAGLRRPSRRSPSPTRCPTTSSLNVDPDQLARVFVNLMKNAREALEAAERQDCRTAVDVEARATRIDDGVTIVASPTTAPACRRAPATISSSPSRARPGPAAPASASPSPANSSEAHGGTLGLCTAGTRAPASTDPPGREPHRLTSCASLWARPCNGRTPSIWVRRVPPDLVRPACAPLAQLDRAPDYESGGQEFESLRARQSIHM